MAENSGISWTTHTANLWFGCTKVHAGCDNCYAEKQSKRFGDDLWGNDKPRRAIKSFFTDLARFQRLAKEAGEIHKVFVGSMMDIFEKPMPFIDSKGIEVKDMTTDDLRKAFFTSISMGEYPNLMFLLLTKRPSNINKYIPASWKVNPPANVMFGTSPVNQETADKLIPQLLQVNGAKFLSVEPMLGKINMNPLWLIGAPAHKGQVDWIIVGGESGHGRRHFDLAWARLLRDQCQSFKVPFFFKQIDKVIEKESGIPIDLQVQDFPNFAIQPTA